MARNLNPFDWKQLVIIAVVVVAIAYFVSTSAFVAVSNVNAASSGTYYTTHCLDTDGDSPGTAGIIAYLTMPSSVSVAPGSGGLGNITYVSLMESRLNYSMSRVLYQPPGVTGNGITGVLTIIRDVGETATTYSTDTLPSGSEPGNTPDTAPNPVSSALLSEQICPSPNYYAGNGFFMTVWDAANNAVIGNQPKHYVGNAIRSGAVTIPINPAVVSGFYPYADYLV